MAGASGFLGTAWRDHLAREGHEVVRLVRGEAMSDQESQWDPHRGELDRSVIEKADVVACLSGSALAGNPHSAKYRKTLRDSRVNPTATLAKAIAASDRKPVFVAQNGTSFYGDRGGEELREDSGTAPGSLLTEVTREWQEATEPAAEAGARVVVLRTAPVMHAQALTFRLLKTVFKTGLAGPLGDGQQYFPLITLQDWLRAATFLLERDASSGPYNLSIPEPCTNAEFTRALAEVFIGDDFPAAPATSSAPEAISVPVAELEAVLAHELGHFKLKHIVKRIAVMLLQICKHAASRPGPAIA